MYDSELDVIFSLFAGPVGSAAVHQEEGETSTSERPRALVRGAGVDPGQEVGRGPTGGGDFQADQADTGLG